LTILTRPVKQYPLQIPIHALSHTHFQQLLQTTLFLLLPTLSLTVPTQIITSKWLLAPIQFIPTVETTQAIVLHLLELNNSMQQYSDMELYQDQYKLRLWQALLTAALLARA
jgi:hypothetical protein